MKYLGLLFAVTCAVAFSPPARAVSDSVKRSSSDICHDSGSAWFDRTKSFKPYSSMENCVRAGGRPYRGYSNAVERAKLLDAEDGYSRELFPHWLDVDNDCQDTRAEVLIAQSQRSVTFIDERHCFVTTGYWYDPYTNRHYSDDDDLDIDHIVPLKWSYNHGAEQWPVARKAVFANDFDNLIAVKNSANREKSAMGPDRWLPENHGYRCDYIERFVFIVNKYQLTFTPTEARTVNRMLTACG